MAKCVVCTALNMGVEHNRHPNLVTAGMKVALQRRWNEVSKRENNRYCALHSTTGNGRATGEFIPLAKAKMEERQAQP